MGVFNDTMELISDISNTIASNISDKKTYSSLQARAKEGTLQFPHIVSRNLDIETAQMVCKASERALSTFVQIAMSMSPTLSGKDGTDAVDYVRQFHTNLLGKSSASSYGQAALKAFVSEGYNGFVNNNLGTVLCSITMNDKTTSLIASNKEQMSSILDVLNKRILNETIRPNVLCSIRNVPVSEAKNNKAVGSHDDNRSFDNSKTDNRIDNRVFNDNRVIGGSQQQTKKPKDFDVTLNKDMLLDNDVKKSNELVSTLVHVRIQLLSKDNNELVGYQDFILGVKALMHPVGSDELISNLIAAYRGNNKLFDFIRWTSGEISFAKDFVLNISRAKQDVLNRSAGASPLWISAKRSRNIAKIYNKVGKDSLYPNVTIIITKQEVDYIKDNYGIDFMNIRDVDKVIDELFLITFIVVDTASQICHFKYEASDDYESVSFSGLERENSSDERKFKEMLKALNRS